MKSIKGEMGRYFGVELWISLNRRFFMTANIRGIWAICLDLGRNVGENLRDTIEEHLKEVL